MIDNATVQPWSHLVNAKHIDKILSLFAHDRKPWTNAGHLFWPGGWDHKEYDAWDVAYQLALSTDINRIGIWQKTHDFCKKIPIGKFDERIESVSVVQSALMALIAYNNCGCMLDFTPEQIHVYACLGVPAAILLEPAVTAIREYKNDDYT